MANRNAFSLHCVLSIREDAEKQIGNAVVQQVDFVYVQDPSVGFCQQAGLKHCLALLHQYARACRVLQGCSMQALVSCERNGK